MRRSPGVRPVYTLRLARSERHLLQAAASLDRLTLAEYIRRSALAAARSDLAR